MARTVNLGDVGFGLVANTASLQRSLGVLKDFGQTVDKVRKTSDESAQNIVRKFASVEKILLTLFQRTSALTDKMKKVGVAQEEINKVTGAYRRLANTLTDVNKLAALPPNQIARGVTGFRGVLSRGQTAVSDTAKQNAEASRAAAALKAVSTAGAALGTSPGGGFTSFLRDLSRSATLTLGPLSGVGARLSVLTSLFSETTKALALTVAGITAVGFGVATLSVAVTKAGIDMQKFTAGLTVATGSSLLAAEQFGELSAFAGKLGVDVRSIVDPFNKFATSARLSNLSLDQMNNVFEGAIIAAQAFKLDSQRTGQVFLAFEQMISKGVVTMEELRRQLGDQIPGAFAIAAKSMGVTQKEFTEMIRAGEVLPDELLPKMAAAFKEIFGPAAAINAKSLTGQFGTLKTTVFESLAALEELTGITDTLTGVVSRTTNVLKDFTAQFGNIRKVIVGAAGAAGGLLFLAFLSKLEIGIFAAISALLKLRTAILAVGFASATLTRLNPILLGLSAASIGLTLALSGTEKQTTSTITKNGEWLTSLRGQIALFREIGEISTQVHSRLLAQATARRNEIAEQLRTAQENLKLAKVPEIRGLIRRQVVNTDRVNEAKAAVLGLEGNLQRVTVAISALNGLNIVAPETKELEESSKKWESWAKSVEESVNKFKETTQQVAAAKRGTSALASTRALIQARNLLASAPEDKKGVGSVFDDLAAKLKTAGFEASTLEQQLAAMFLEISKGEEKLSKLESLPQDLERANAAVSKQLSKLAVPNVSPLLATTPQFEVNQNRTAAVEEFKRSLEELNGLLALQGSTLVEVNPKVREFIEAWNKKQAFEESKKSIEQLRRSLDSLESSLGSGAEKSARAQSESLRIITEAENQKLITTQRGAELRAKVDDKALAEMLDRQQRFGISIRSLLRSVESTMTQTFSSLFTRTSGGFKKMFSDILQSMLDFIVQVGIVKPIMTALFGELFTGIANTGKGLLGGLFSVLGSVLASALGGGASAGAGASSGSLPAVTFHAASGGLVGANKLGQVNENGFEVFRQNNKDFLLTGGSGGEVIPNNRLGGTSVTNNTSINVVVSGNNTSTSTNSDTKNRDAKELGSLIEVGVKTILAKEGRPGGVLWKLINA